MDWCCYSIVYMGVVCGDVIEWLLERRRRRGYFDGGLIYMEMWCYKKMFYYVYGF